MSNKTAGYAKILIAPVPKWLSAWTASITNAKLFRMEDNIGTIEIGKWADIIAVAGNPDEDIELLGDMNNIRFVMKSGEIMKNI